MREAYRITIHVLVLCKLRTEYPVAFTHEYEKTPCPLGLKPQRCMLRLIVLGLGLS